ncbi:vascular cell adhesion protein 1-like [Danio aesculapii]|uniref:vascular cell adhesion protein 1-like n=1 Tax=Danio aesculapii TaxID=1142201 RepID=UPI0024BFDF76|nr:vascular cell adhesion protein 1-like [Danio aesculapii]
MSQYFFRLFSLSALAQLLSLSGTLAECPLQISPQSVVVKYGDSVSVNCSTSVTHQGMGWESTMGAVSLSIASLITLRVSELTDWDIYTPFCYINYDRQQCTVDLPVTVYKTPDSVSISTVNQAMTEGNQYELQCDVHNVAPAQNLTINWYKGETLVDQTNFTDTTKSPVSKTSNLAVRPDRADDGAQYRCEAELNLGDEGPQPHPTVTSEPFSITVKYGDCPIYLNPRRAVVKYGSSVSANCKAFVPHNGMGWESSVGAVPMSTASLITWRVSELTDWDIYTPFCYINYDRQQCTVDLPVTVYKTPDSVSISTGNQAMTEGNQYELQCDVHNVAPAQSLTVNWYKGETLVDQTNFTDTTKSPVSKTSNLAIRPDRADDGAQFRCEAELNLGEIGPQPPPTVTSKPFSIEVHYKPKHSSSTEIISQSNDVSLNCTVKANPAAVYTWHSEHLTEKISSSVIQSPILNPGKYTCTATNYLGEDSKEFIV